jgi:hypothetical protein
MEIGKPRRVIEIDPVSEPVPEPVPVPEQVPREPSPAEPVPAGD